MTFTEKYQAKLDRLRLAEESKKQRSMKRRAKAKLRQNQSVSLKLKARHRKQRAELLRLQGYKCAICKRPYGEVKLVADSYHQELVRGMLCGRCNVMLTRFADNPDLIAAYTGKRIGKRLLTAAIKYLSNWPSSRLDYMIFRQKFVNLTNDECTSNFDNSLT